MEKIAQELVDLYAHRAVSKGFAFSGRDQMFKEFEAAFPYEETPDQLRVIEEVLGDMESEKPMDRLVCGDVGYGKTEVALRAAFGRCWMENRWLSWFPLRFWPSSVSDHVPAF